MSKCKSCGADIVWIQSSKTGKWIPCDEGLREYYMRAGDWPDTIIKDNGEVIRCSLKRKLSEKPDGLGRTPHWAICPDADKFRKGKGNQNA